MNKLLIALLFFVTLVGCAGYVPGRQSYWDAQVREMCAKDGGVQVIEKIKLTKSEIAFLGGDDRNISIPIKEVAHPSAPVYAEIKDTVIREANPSVWRSESLIVRRRDQLVVARWVAYSRSGGDLPTGLAHDSRLTCPDLQKMRSDLQQLFILEGGSK